LHLTSVGEAERQLRGQAQSPSSASGAKMAGLGVLGLYRSGAPEQQFLALASKRFAVGAPASVIDMPVAQHRCGINHLSMRVGSSPALSFLAARFFPRCGTEPRPRGRSAAIEGNRRSGVAQVQRPSQISQWGARLGGDIIAPRRSNSAHLHRPWRSAVRLDAGFRSQSS
jgi:hypothetical protein